MVAKSEVVDTLVAKAKSAKSPVAKAKSAKSPVAKAKSLTVSQVAGSYKLRRRNHGGIANFRGKIIKV